MEDNPLIWMYSAQSHLSLLDKVQRQAECLILGASGHGQELHTTQQQQQQQRPRLHTPAAQSGAPQASGDSHGAAQSTAAANTSFYGASGPVEECAHCKNGSVQHLPQGAEMLFSKVPACFLPLHQGVVERFHLYSGRHHNVCPASEVCRPHLASYTPA
ncbi:hypothetical protein E2C01_057084 [Portunus trituberculatus]|uniref:Uncharacterized protein n=1 Tax=Portunus trituberculatus TaxID=210409 RepID=A0A5B7GVV6_PORTR|nr:hypothetical protein [Portunus trituberculatus]